VLEKDNNLSCCGEAFQEVVEKVPNYHTCVKVKIITKRVIWLLVADWLKAVVYENMGMTKNIFYCSNYVGNQFIITIVRIRR
jgi:hypothetical protein